MVSPDKKTIFYLEDDPDILAYHCKSLQEYYTVLIGAHWKLIKQKRLLDLAILDLRVHNSSRDYVTGEDVENIHFDGVHWKQTGLEFLRRLRNGDYEEWGFAHGIPVIVGTAEANKVILDQVRNLEISALLEKPYTVEELREAVEKALVS